MKFPSLQSLSEKAATTFKRFPFAMASAIVASLCLIRLNETGVTEPLKEMYMKLAMACYLGLVLFMSAVIFGERLGWMKSRILLVSMVVAALLTGYYFSIADVNGTYTWMRFILYALGSHFLVAVVPYLDRSEPNGFWQYNKTLFLRFLTSALYSSVLYVGISLALLAVDKLFEADIDGQNYFRLWVIIAGIFNTWFFLAGIPDDYEGLQQINEYPRGLKAFTQYVLLPLVSLYLVILYSYEVKIIVTQHWPVGWVSYLVLGFSIAGILSLLLIWPVKEGEGNAWIKSFSRFFYFALFPLIVLLIVAIWKRVAAYGVTESRYFLLILAGWLVCTAAYFLFSRKKNIKLIPISLCLLAFGCSFGPWGAFSVSRRSQQQRFEMLLAKNNMMEQGKARKTASKIPFEDNRQISSIIDYLTEVHGTESLQAYFSEPLDTSLAGDGLRNNRYEARQAGSRKVHRLLGIEEVSRFADAEDESKAFNYNVTDSAVHDIAGYGFSVKCTFRNGSNTGADSFAIGSRMLSVRYMKEEDVLLLNEQDSIIGKFNLRPFCKDLYSAYTSQDLVPSGKMVLNSAMPGATARLDMEEISGEFKMEKPEIHYFTGNLLIKLP